MKTLSTRIAALTVAAAAALGTASLASASEKTFGQDETPSFAATVVSQEVARGKADSRIGHYGRTLAGSGSQVAAVPSHAEVQPKGGNR